VWLSLPLPGQLAAARQATAMGKPQVCVMWSKSCICSNLGEDSTKKKVAVDRSLIVKEYMPTSSETIEEGPCLWSRAHSQASKKPLCEDGTFTWDCVGERHGQRLQCPDIWPFMCSSMTCSSSKQNYCCEKDCSSKGGLRPANNCPLPTPGCAPKIPLDLVFLLDSLEVLGGWVLTSPDYI